MKKFAGFTPEQQYTLLQKQGYRGPMREDVMDMFMASNPGVAAKMGKYASVAQERLSEREFATGGFNFLDLSGAIGENLFDTDTDTTTEDQTQVEQATEGLGLYSTQSDAVMEAAIEEPDTLVTAPAVAQTDEETGQIAEGTGQITSPTPQAEATTVQQEQVQQAQAPEYFDPATFDPTKITPELQQQLSEIEAAQAQPSKDATVRGQLEELMQDFEDGTPPWAAGAMRQAMGIMQQRGMGASSMAGQAVVQAAMEAALPIAVEDARTYAKFEMQNLNNRQQTLMFKTQQTVAGMFSDQAAENAAKQFNATSENQTRQFFASLQESVSRFNAAQVNGILQFNAGQANQIETFNTQLEEAREQFNAQNAVVISQANAQLRANIATTNTAAQNAANMQYAQSMTGLTAAAMDQLWQKERDLMTMVFTAAENQLDRDAEIAMAKLTAKQQQDYADNVGKGQIIGSVVGAVAGGIFG